MDRNLILDRSLTLTLDTSEFLFSFFRISYFWTGFSTHRKYIDHYKPTVRKERCFNVLKTKHIYSDISDSTKDTFHSFRLSHRIWLINAHYRNPYWTAQPAALYSFDHTSPHTQPLSEFLLLQDHSVARKN